MGRTVESKDPIEVGNNDHRYRVVADWPHLPEEVTIQEVVAAACNRAGQVFLFNRGSHPILIFDPCGKLVDSIADFPTARPHGITVGPDDTIYCVDDFDHTVKVLSPSGQRLRTLGTSGQFSDTGAVTIDYRTIKHAGPPFNYPTNLAIAASGELYIADGYGNARIHRFSPEGNLIDSWGDSGEGPGQFQVPHGIAISPEEIVYVADRENNRIQRFDLQGQFIDQWTDVVRPTEVFVTDDSTVYVSELGARAGRWPGWPDAPTGAIGGRLSIFNSDGELLARWGGGDDPCAPGDFFAPHDVSVDCCGDIYVSEVVWSAGANKGAVSPQCHTIQKFSRM
ncbi:MAG: peptidyl-alpha-hydroxyglycine alpha-amidating lyase family protein [Pirellulaceae bacterium]|nr:peptidyl-alpha-hydroxyglycine alpha-amidating lyase family protein [Pirellulaceae bacterium]